MNGGKSPREKSHPATHGARTSPPHIGGKHAMIKISHSTTSDIPDGRPWPPPDRDVLWVVVRRANGCTLWRAIHLVISRFPAIAATTGKTKVHPVVDRVRGRVVRAAGILGPPTPPDSIHRNLGSRARARMRPAASPDMT
jgi:hypothetical protein